MINVEELRELGGGPLMGYYAKGHHDAAAFIESVNHWLDRHDKQIAGERYVVKHVYWRNVPATEYGEGFTLFVEAPGPGRGAYPVTVVEVD